MYSNYNKKYKREVLLKDHNSNCLQHRVNIRHPEMPCKKSFQMFFVCMHKVLVSIDHKKIVAASITNPFALRIFNIK